MPDSVAHLVDYLFEVGPTYGDRALPFTEVESWARQTGVVLGSFAASALHALSSMYLGQLRQAMDANCPPPELRREGLPTREEISNGLRNMLRAMSAAHAKKKKAGKLEKKGAKP